MALAWLQVTDVAAYVGDRQLCQLCSASHQIQETPANMHLYKGTRSLRDSVHRNVWETWSPHV